MEIGRKYCQRFNIQDETFSIMLRRHIAKQHPPLLADTPIEEPVQGDTFEDYAKSLLKMGMTPDLMSPQKVSHNNIISAKRALLEEKKLNNEMNAQKLAFLKFFRGSVVEGEIVDGEDKSAGTKDIPSNTE
jgi:hypothetical protein